MRILVFVDMEMDTFNLLNDSRGYTCREVAESAKYPPFFSDKKKRITKSATILPFFSEKKKKLPFFTVKKKVNESSHFSLTKRKEKKASIFHGKKINMKFDVY